MAKAGRPSSLPQFPFAAERLGGGSFRVAQRRPLQATVQFRKGQSRAQVDLLDVSTHGVKLAAVHLLRTGDRFWLKLPRLAPQEMRVAWSDHFIVGCEFVAPLHPSVVDSLLSGN